MSSAIGLRMMLPKQTKMNERARGEILLLFAERTPSTSITRKRA
jgi:hypothetical protein